MLAGLFILMPKPDYRVLDSIDVSFLFHPIEKEIQNQIVKTGPVKTHHKSAKRDVIKSEELKTLPVISKEITEAISRPSTTESPVSLPVDTTIRAATAIYSSEGSGIHSSAGEISNMTSVSASVSAGEKTSDSGIKTASRSGGDLKSGDEGIDMSGIIEALTERIESLKQYPYIARRMGIEGTAIVFVKIDVMGNLQYCRIKTSSGHKILDENALTLIKRAFPFKHNSGMDIKVEIPITYRLVR
jgi:protein TonB